MQRSVTFGAVKARLYDAPGATKVTVAGEGRETLAPSSAKLSQKPQKLLLWFATPRNSTESKPSDERWKSNKEQQEEVESTWHMHLISKIQDIICQLSIFWEFAFMIFLRRKWASIGMGEVLKRMNLRWLITIWITDNYNIWITISNALLGKQEQPVPFPLPAQSQQRLPRIA